LKQVPGKAFAKVIQNKDGYLCGPKGVITYSVSLDAKNESSYPFTEISL